jgi:hypothetical protein
LQDYPTLKSATILATARGRGKGRAYPTYPVTLLWCISQSERPLTQSCASSRSLILIRHLSFETGISKEYLGTTYLNLRQVIPVGLERCPLYRCLCRLGTGLGDRKTILMQHTSQSSYSTFEFKVSAKGARIFAYAQVTIALVQMIARRNVTYLSGYA